MALFLQSKDFASFIAAIGDRQKRLRVVRQLPLCADLSEPGEAWGQLLDKPPGRKPRGRADEISSGAALWGFDGWQKPM